MAAAGSPNGPRSARGRFSFTAQNMQRQTQHFREGEVRVWGFRTLECVESKKPPTRRDTTPGLPGRVQGLCAPDFIQGSAPLLQVEGGLSLYRRKTRFKNTLVLWFLYQRPSAYSRLRRRREVARQGDTRNRSKLPPRGRGARRKPYSAPMFIPSPSAPGWLRKAGSVHNGG